LLSCCWPSSKWLWLWLHCTCRLISSLFSIGTVPYLKVKCWGTELIQYLAVSLQVTACMVMSPAVGCHYLPPGPQWHTCIVINSAVGCHYFLPGQQLPSQLSGITSLRPVPTYTAWWQKHIGVRNVPRVFTPWARLRLKPTTSWSLHLVSYYSAPKNRFSFYHLTEKTLLVSMELILTVSMLAWCCMCFCMCCSCELQSNCCPANGCVSLRCVHLQLLIWCMQTNSRQMFMCIS